MQNCKIFVLFCFCLFLFLFLFFVLFCFILFYFILFCFVLFRFVTCFCSSLFVCLFVCFLRFLFSHIYTLYFFLKCPRDIVFPSVTMLVLVYYRTSGSWIWHLWATTSFHQILWENYHWNFVWDTTLVQTNKMHNTTWEFYSNTALFCSFKLFSVRIVTAIETDFVSQPSLIFIKEHSTIVKCWTLIGQRTCLHTTCSGSSAKPLYDWLTARLRYLRHDKGNSQND